MLKNGRRLKTNSSDVKGLRKKEKEEFYISINKYFPLFGHLTSNLLS